jgi:hypothetical protein
MRLSPFPWFPFLPLRGARVLKNRASWLLPFCAIAAARVALLLLAEGETAEAVLAHLPASGRAEAASMLAEESLARALVEPARLLAGWGAFAGILWIAVRALKPPDPVPYLSLLALETHAETVSVFAAGGSLVAALITGNRALALVPGAFAGAAAVAPAGVSFAAVSLLGGLNFFTLWYAASLAAGLRVLCGFSMRLSVLITACAWILSVLFDLGITTLLVTTLHLRV